MLTLGILSVLASTTLFAAISTVWLQTKGWPKGAELQGPHRKFGKFKQRLPLIVTNLTLLFVGPGLVLPYLSDHFVTTMPSGFDILAAPLIILIFDDTLFYFWHRFLHQNKWMYRKIHRLHHKAFAPLPLDYIYAHPIEWMVGALGPIFGMVFISYAFGELSAWSFGIFTLVRQLHEINIHSGTRSVVLNHIPEISSTDSHDMHHLRPNAGNYGSIFEHWDYIFSTKVKAKKNKLG